jgi:hypothetical protein
MPSPALQAVRRKPAPPSFVARRLACIAWGRAPSQRLWLVETCRAELEWAVAEWRLLADDPDDRGPGPHPSEEWRLPHERAAARVVNCHLHLDVAQWRLAELVPRLRRQRAAALDGSRPEVHRLYWADAAVATVGDLRSYLVRRRLAWRCYLAAAADYRRLKGLIGQQILPIAA